MLHTRNITAGGSYTQPAARVSLPVDRPRTRISWKKAALFLVAVACFLLSLLTIAQYSYTVSLNYQLSRSENTLNRLHEDYRALELNAAHLSSLSRVETIAREELGMREPEKSQLKVLTAGGE